MLNNINFRAKLYIIFFTIVIIPITVVVSVLYRRLVYEITNQISNIVATTLNFTSEYIETSLDTVRLISAPLIEEEELVAASRLVPTITDMEIIDINISIQKLLNEYINQIRRYNSSFGFESFYIYLPKHSFLINSRIGNFEYISPQDIDLTGDVTDNKTWFITRRAYHYPLFNLDHQNVYNNLLSSTYKILDENNSPALILAVNISFDFISNYYSSIQKGIPGDFLVIDDTGSIIAAGGTPQTLDNKIFIELLERIEISQKQAGNFEVTVNNENYFAVFLRSINSGWNYIVLIPPVEIFGQIHNVQKFFIFLIIIITVLIIPIYFMITRTLYNPLEKLVLAMQNVKNGDLDTTIIDSRRDEYQKVYEGFNLMLGNLRQLIEDLSSEKSLNKQAELNLIQAQINPHFLYNTLESIYSIATIHKLNEISNMAAALSKFFRVSLSEGKTDICLKDALEIVKSYLTIQNIRFTTKIEYVIDIPEKYLSLVVPKLLLQPIVENSIYHGLEKKKGKGKLSISCSETGETFFIHIEDDGVGIPKGRLAALRRAILGDENEGYFALKTLNRQIVLKYGKNYGLSIESKINKGTRVTISLPLSQ